MVSRGGADAPDGVLVARSLEEALTLAAGDEEVFVIGGEQIYRLAMPHADRMYLTIVHAPIGGDTHFPEFDPGQWRLVDDQRHEPDDRHAHAYSFRTYERVREKEATAARRRKS